MLFSLGFINWIETLSTSQFLPIIDYIQETKKKKKRRKRQPSFKKERNKNTPDTY